MTTLTNQQLLNIALLKWGVDGTAQRLDVAPAQVKSWNKAGVEHMEPQTEIQLRAAIDQDNERLHNPRATGDFTFIDLFAGIGGIRRGFEQAGGQCVFTSEWNPFAQRTYAANFPLDHALAGDITKVDVNDIPDCDLVLGGFPCQPFSIAGVSKKNSMGRDHGFLDKTQGTLFFDVARIIADKKPKAFLLENVKNLVSHDKGKTFEVIKDTLEKQLGYQLFYKVIDGAHFTPQHRERIFLVGFRDPCDFSWDDVKLPAKSEQTLAKILHQSTEAAEPPFTQAGSQGAVINSKYTLTPKLWEYLQNYALKHKAKGNGFGYGLVRSTDVARTLSARYYKDGSEILVDQGPNSIPRRLTPRECARLMGYPETFNIVASDTQAYKQFGNSVVVPVIEEIARAMAQYIHAPKPKRKMKK